MRKSLSLICTKTKLFYYSFCLSMLIDRVFDSLFDMAEAFLNLAFSILQLALDIIDWAVYDCALHILCFAFDLFYFACNYIFVDHLFSSIILCQNETL